MRNLHDDQGHKHPAHGQLATKKLPSVVTFFIKLVISAWLLKST